MRYNIGEDEGVGDLVIDRRVVKYSQWQAFELMWNRGIEELKCGITLDYGMS